MSFYGHSSCYNPCYQPCYQPSYEPCYQPCDFGTSVGYGRRASACDSCRFSYGSSGYDCYPRGCGGTSYVGPCNYGYRYTRRGSCYDPSSFRLGYGARLCYPSRRCSSGSFGPF